MCCLGVLESGNVNLRVETGADNVSAFLETLGTMKVEYNACAEDEEVGIDQAEDTR